MRPITGPWHTDVVTFDEVYQRFRGPVWRLARRLTGDEEEALEATQEIFLRIWRGLAGFRGEAKLSTWVFQVAWNYLRMAHRRKVQRGRFSVVGDEGETPLVERLADPAPGPERRLEASQRLRRVETALAGLEEHHRTVLWLRDGEGLSYEDIAAALDVPIGTVRSRLARARANLRKAVDQ